MSAYKRTAGYVATGLLALTLSFGAANDAYAQSKDKRLAFNGISGKADVEAVAKATMNAPIVKKGTAGDAAVASNDDRLAIHIISRNGANMPREKYAKMLANAFADRKYTDKPMYITVTHEHRDTPGETQAIIYMDGGDYETQEGYNVFTPEQIGGAIKAISNEHVKRHGDKHVIKDGVEPTLIASVN